MVKLNERAVDCTNKRFSSLPDNVQVLNRRVRGKERESAQALGTIGAMSSGPDALSLLMLVKTSYTSLEPISMELSWLAGVGLLSGSRMVKSLELKTKLK